MKMLWKPFNKRFDLHMIELRNQCKAVEKEAGLSHYIESANARAEARSNQELISKRKYGELHRSEDF